MAGAGDEHRPGWWSQVEEEWLGRVVPPFRELAEREGWRPDARSAYCPRCAGSVGEFEAVLHEGPDFGCPACRTMRLPWARAIRLGSYESLLRSAIHQAKFTAFRRLGESLGELLGEQLLALLAEASLSPANVRLVPVPTSFLRRFHRGIHHTLAIARGARRSTGIKIANLLSRRHGPSQLDVPPSQRSKAVRGMMRMRRSIGPEIRLLVILDDVMTTGATMREACRAIGAGRGKSRENHGPNGTTGVERPSGTPIPTIWVGTCGVTPRSTDA